MNDLHFVQQLLRYRVVDRDVPGAALKVPRRHGWYLTQELVVFSLFSDKVGAEEKSDWRCDCRRSASRMSWNWEPS